MALLNRLGRRKDASEQADVLCRDGQINEQELLSLLRRNDSFPFRLEGDDQKNISNLDWEWQDGTSRSSSTAAACRSLRTEYQAGFPTPEASGIVWTHFGGDPDLQEMPAWYAKCGERGA